MTITVVGSLNYDLVTYTDRVPDAGETFRANHFETHMGGKGLNQTIAVARLKKDNSERPVRMVGNVGADSFGKELLQTLKDNGVDVDSVGVWPDVKTGVATILVEQQSGQNRIMITAGANGKTTYTGSELAGIFSEQETNSSGSYIVFQHEIPDPCSVMHWLKTNRPASEIVFNPSPFQPLREEDWAVIDVLVVNEIEALQIVQSVYSQEQLQFYEAAISSDFVEGYKRLALEFQKRLVSQRGSATVIITLGSHGALFASKEHPEVGYVPAERVDKVVDTTAAGDTFLGGVVSQLHQGVPLEDTIEFSSVASSLTIQRKGAADSIPAYSEVVSRLQARGRHGSGR